MTFNIAYDTNAFALERHRIQLTGCYQLLCYTGVRPAELVDGQRKGPKDGSLEKLFGRKVVQDVEADVVSDAPDEETRHLDQLLLQETTKRGRPKALCYEDILLMLVRHPTTGATIPAMAIKFIHHKGADNKPKPFVSSHYYNDVHRPMLSSGHQYHFFLHTHQEASVQCHHGHYCSSSG